VIVIVQPERNASSIVSPFTELQLISEGTTSFIRYFPAAQSGTSPRTSKLRTSIRSLAFSNIPLHIPGWSPRISFRNPKSNSTEVNFGSPPKLTMHEILSPGWCRPPQEFAYSSHTRGTPVAFLGLPLRERIFPRPK
jgi:hypothetical protein